MIGDDETVAPGRYRLCLFIAGSSPRSRRTLENLRRVCDAHLRDNFDLDVVDIYQQPHLAEAHQVVAAPTLVKVLPQPLRRIIGDLTDEARLLRGLDLPGPTAPGPTAPGSTAPGSTTPGPAAP